MEETGTRSPKIWWVAGLACQSKFGSKLVFEAYQGGPKEGTAAGGHASDRFVAAISTRRRRN